MFQDNTRVISPMTESEYLLRNSSTLVYSLQSLSKSEIEVFSLPIQTLVQT